MVSDRTLAILGLLGIGGVALAAVFLSRPHPEARLANELGAAPRGWHNEEVVDVIRNGEGFIERLVVHRNVETN